MSNQLIMGWNQLAATLLDWHTDPGNDTRRFAIFQIAIHDALNHIKPVYHKWKKRPPVAANPALVIQDVLDAAVNAAAATTLRMAIKEIEDYINKLPITLKGKYPTFKPVAFQQQIIDYFNSNMATIANSPSKSYGEAVGIAMANEIIALRSTDGSSTAILSPRPDEDQDGKFQSEYYNDIVPSGDKFMLNYGKVIPFALDSSQQFRQNGPPALNSIQYTTELAEVRMQGTQAYYQVQDQKKKNIIDYWSSNKQHIV
jgi:hypothetical protein